MAVKLLFFILLSSFSCLSSGEDETLSRSVLRSACSSTLYPELCHSSLAAQSSLLADISDQKDVIHGAISSSKTAVQHVSATVHKIRSSRSKDLTEREIGALDDCLEMFDETLEELAEADKDLSSYNPGESSKALAKHADDLKTLIGAAITNQGSCLDGFSHDAAERRLREEIKEAVVHVSHLCSNALAMVTNMTTRDIALKLEIEEKEQGKKSENRKLLKEEHALEVDEEGFPAWMPAADRRLLQGSVTPDVVVASDGSGNFKTISAAVQAAPSGSSKKYIIKIKAGTYKENVDVPRPKTNLVFVGDGAGKTIITGSRNVVDGSTTFHSATVAVVGGGFLGRDLTIENTAGPSKHQAVALRVGSDFSAFYRCQIRAYQDTLYVHSLRQFFRDCDVSGTVDFIFGNAAVVLQNCNLIVRKPNPGQRNMVTAQGREDPNQNTGISIQRCTIAGASDLSSSTRSYLGRPWKQYSRTVIMQSTISGIIDPAGWFEWSGNFALDTLTYREYQNAGAGAGTSGRVTWKGYTVITSASEAQQYTVGGFIGGSGWLGSTGVPFSLGL